MVSEHGKTVIFYGIAGLWVLWGVVDYFFRYSFQVYLSVMIFGLVICTGIVSWRKMNYVVPAGNVRLDNSIKIP